MDIVMKLVGILIFMLIYIAFISFARFLAKALTDEESKKCDAESGSESDEAVIGNCDCATNHPWHNEGEFGSLL